MAFTRTAIDTLFGTDPRGGRWTAFSTDNRDDAVAQAERLLTFYWLNVKGNTTGLTEAASALTATKRHDWAVAIQALHLLEHQKVLADGTAAGPKYVANVSQGEKAKKTAGQEYYDPTAAKWSTEALMYLTGETSPVMPGGAGDAPRAWPGSITFNRTS